MKEFFGDFLPMLWHHGTFNLRAVVVAGSMFFSAGLLTGWLIAIKLAY